MKENRAFTLIELLAVIIILGLLMAIAIPMVSRYIQESRKKSYVATANSYVNGVTKEIASGNIPSFHNEDTIYYVPFKCIKTERGVDPKKSWDFAYVLITNNNSKRNYYIYAKGSDKLGIPGVKLDKLTNKDVRTINETSNDLISVEGKQKISLVTDTCDFANLQETMPGKIPENECFEVSSNGSMTKYYSENPDCYSKDLHVPSHVNGIAITTLHTYLFRELNLETVSLPNTIENIGYASLQSNQIRRVKIPEGVKVVGTGSFQGNPLEEVELPSTVLSLNLRAFYGCNLKEVKLPNGLKEIGYGAFLGNDLKTVDIPASVTKIGGRAFWNNYNLETIRLIGRSNLDGLTVEPEWNGTGTIVFVP